MGGWSRQLCQDCCGEVGQAERPRTVSGPVRRSALAFTAANGVACFLPHYSIPSAGHRRSPTSGREEG